MDAEPTEPAGAPGARAHDPYAAFRQPNFRFYVSGNIIATIGQQMQTVAVGWELYERTGSALALGGVGLVQVLPIVLLTLPAGHVADRYSRRRVLMLSQLLFIVSSLGLAAVSYRHGHLALGRDAHGSIIVLLTTVRVRISMRRRRPATPRPSGARRS